MFFQIIFTLLVVFTIVAIIVKFFTDLLLKRRYIKYERPKRERAKQESNARNDGGSKQDNSRTQQPWTLSLQPLNDRKSEVGGVKEDKGSTGKGLFKRLGFNGK